MSAARFREAAKVLRERADMATEGHIWHAALDSTVEVCCECGTARKKAPEPESVTVSLPRDVVEAAWGLLIYASTSITIADRTREMYFKAADDLLAALDAASATQEADQ